MSPSRSFDVTIVTHAALPDGAPDDRLLARALAERGAAVRFAVWDDPAVDWAASRLTIVRSAWDYHRKPQAWLAWVDAVQSRTRLENPPAVLRWNTDKRYLRELDVPIVPTEWIEPGGSFRLPTERPFVVKPAVSAGAKDTARYAPGDPAAVEHVRRLQAAGRVAMAQPYLEGIDVHGETGMIFIDRVFSHAIRKGAILRPDVEYVNGLFAKESIGRREPTREERELAERTLAQVKGELLYARVDVAPGPDGRPVLLELELTEPSLFFAQSDGAERRLARAIAARC